MDNPRYRPRIIDPMIEKYLNTFGAVCLEGAKWTGKTWSSLYHCNSSIMLGDPEGRFQNRRLAEMSPSAILEGDTPRLIDEWQEVPPLWDAVRHQVDMRGRPGQFLLTGSSTPNRKGVLHSGAGRIASLRMRPMSLYESGDSSGRISLERLCSGEIETCLTGEVSLKKLAGLIIRGGWPATLGMPLEQAALLPEAYLQSILNNDIFRIDDRKHRDASKLRLLLRSLARNECSTASIRTLTNDIRETDEGEIETVTVREYLDIFARLFLTDDQPPFSENIRSQIRVKQSSKRHLADPSLACALLNVTQESLIGDLATMGFLFESLCERDLRIYAESFGGRLYHYQDYANNEIDAVVTRPDGEWCAIEIKLGANQIDKAAKNLLTLKKKAEESTKGHPPSVLCVLCGLSNSAYRREDGVFVVPITALRN